MNKHYDIVLELIRDILSLKSNVDIKPTDDLRCYGLDSMNYIELIIEIEKFFGITVPEDKLGISATRNIRDIWKLIEELEINETEL